VVYNQSTAVTNNIYAIPPLKNYQTHYTSTKDARRLTKALSDRDSTFHNVQLYFTWHFL